MVLCGYHKLFIDFFRIGVSINYVDMFVSLFVYLYIFKKILQTNEWKICEKVDNKFFVKNEKYFKFYGGDMETLFFNCKVVHAKRIFGLPKNFHKIINNDDIKKAFKIFKINRVISKDDDSWKNLYI